MSDGRAQTLPTRARPTLARIDVGLLLEGTYPYVSGGVSSWVHEIITGLPELTFGAIFLGASPETYGEIRYRAAAEPGSPRDALPDVGPAPAAVPRERRAAPARGAASARARPWPRWCAARGLRARGDRARPKVLDARARSERRAGSRWTSSCPSDEIWARLCAEYDAHCESSSFLDYFWTVRTMHRPLFTLAALARRAPEFRVLHAVSTGYAGFLGALLQRQRGCPFVVTEHGIYTKERKIDLRARRPGSTTSAAADRRGLGQDLGYLRRLWIRFFEALGRAAYATARPDHLAVRRQPRAPGRRRRRARAARA